MDAIEIFRQTRYIENQSKAHWGNHSNNHGCVSKYPAIIRFTYRLNTGRNRDRFLGVVLREAVCSIKIAIVLITIFNPLTSMSD